MKLEKHTMERSPEMMERFANDVGEFITDMNVILERVGSKFGDQWR